MVYTASYNHFIKEGAEIQKYSPAKVGFLYTQGKLTDKQLVFHFQNLYLSLEVNIRLLALMQTLYQTVEEVKS